MKVVILCAGYATRLYPITLDTPKPLLLVNGKPLISYTIENLLGVKDIDEIFVVTNNKFYNNFVEWNPNKKKIKIINDGTNRNEERLGGVMDFALVLDKCENEDILIIFGDVYFNFKLKKFVDFYKTAKNICVALRDIQDFEKAKNYGVLELDKSEKIIGFYEKPQVPKSTLINAGAFIFPKEEIPLLKEYIASDKTKENIGFIIQDFIKSSINMKGFVFSENWYDIGTMDDYKRINEDLAKK